MLMHRSHNSTARTQNSYLTDREDYLTPLRHPATNTVIPNFPLTPRDIDQLPSQSANGLLEDLEQGTDGALASRRQRVRIAVGLRAVRREGA